MSVQKGAPNKPKRTTTSTRSTIMIMQRTTSITEREMTMMTLGVVEETTEGEVRLDHTLSTVWH